MIEKINEVFKDKFVIKEVKFKFKYVKNNWFVNLWWYEEQEKIMGGNRNSYFKIDMDVIFMWMKEDYMNNGQLKLGYNLQVSSNNQYIIYYFIY